MRFTVNTSSQSKNGRWCGASHRRALWRRETIRDMSNIGDVIRSVVQAMSMAGFSEDECMAMHVALGEAITNAIDHGNRRIPSKTVVLIYRVNGRSVLVRVEDQGDGFDPHAVPDPRAPENISRPSGRGLLLMRHYMTSVRHSAKGNCVTMWKRRAPRCIG